MSKTSAETFFEGCLAAIDEAEIERSRALNIDSTFLSYIRETCGQYDLLGDVAEACDFSDRSELCEHLSRVYGESVGTVELVLLRGVEG